MRILLAVISLIGLAGCTTFSLQELRQAEPTGDAFQTALANEYLQYSESEAAQYDWIDSQYFAQKGLRAMYGSDVAPENPGDWDLPKEILPEIEKARATLDGLLTAENRKAMPDKLARVQYFYDCWVEQQEENWQVDDIESCKRWFYETASEIAQEAPPEKPLVLSTSYIVFFEWNKSDLTTDGRKVIDAVTKDLLASKEPYEVVLNGHADRSGTDTYNLDLSQRRVDTVKKALVAGGIPEKLVGVYAFGESDPRQPTKDGERLEANRRVEIFINE